MLARAAVTHLPVGKDEPAERHEKLAVAGNPGPAGMLGEHAAERAQNMRYDDLGSSVAVGVFRSCVTADTIQKPVDLALRVMEPAGTGPAI